MQIFHAQSKGGNRTLNYDFADHIINHNNNAQNYHFRFVHALRRPKVEGRRLKEKGTTREGIEPPLKC